MFVFSFDHRAEEVAGPGLQFVGGKAVSPVPSKPALETGLWVFVMAVGLGLTVFSFAWLGTAFSHEAGRTAGLWLANGVAVAVVLRLPRRFAPLLLLPVAAACAAATLVLGETPGVAVALMCANLLEIGIMVAALHPVLGPNERFDRGRVITRFLVAAVIGTAASALLATLAIAPRNEMLIYYWRWASADLLGMLIVGAMLLSIPPSRSRTRRNPPVPFDPRVEQALPVLAVVAIAAFLFIFDLSMLVFALAPLMVFVAFRLPLSLACLAILAVVAVALATTHAGAGPLARLDGTATQVLALQSLVAMMIALVLPVRALVVERNRLTHAWRKSERKVAYDFGVDIY